MTAEERTKIKDFKKCNFKKMHTYFLKETEKKKSMTNEQKQVIIYYIEYSYLILFNRYIIFIAYTLLKLYF